MFKGTTKYSGLVSTLGIAIAITAAVVAHATDAPSLRGEWIGNSLLEGQRETAKTVLSLGAPDDADSVTLRIESRGICTLKQGMYSSGADGAWSLSFKEANGGEACERLTHGNFSLRAGRSPRTLDFDVVYPGRDGSQNHRSGILSHYP